MACSGAGAKVDIVEPLQYQDVECDKMATRLLTQQGLIMKSPPGTGKTLMSYWTGMRYAAQALPAGKRAFLLVLAPSAGGNVYHQWEREAYRAGITNICMYRGAKKSQKYDEWIRKAGDGQVSVMITTPQTMLFDTAGVKNRPGQGFASPLSTTNFFMAIVDEAHWMRNGSPAHDEAEVDQTKKTYSAVDTYLASRNKGIKYLKITATPVNNSKMDLYSLVRFFYDSPKSVWRGSGKGENKEAWDNIKDTIVDKYVYVVDAPPPPETKLATVEHPSSQRERAIQHQLHVDLSDAATGLSAAVSRLKNARTASSLQEYQLALQHFQALLTRTRRALCHPFLAESMPLDPRSPPNKKRRLPVDVQAANQAWPAKDCSKLQELLKVVRENEDRKVLVYTAWSDVVDIVEHFLGEQLGPDRLVLTHHGRDYQPRKNMDEFKQVDQNAVLVGTRASMGTGVDIDTHLGGKPVHIVNLDHALSHAEFEQSLGRVKRPAAGQQMKASYTATDLATVDCQNGVRQETVDSFLKWMQREKKKRSFAVMASREEWEEAEKADRDSDEVSNSSLNQMVAMFGSRAGQSTRKRKRAEERAVAKQPNKLAECV